jgi:hypothetical protein
LQVTTGALPILNANGDTPSTTKGPVMKKRIASKKTGTADGGDKDSDSEFNLDVILGKTELRVCGGGKADTGNCKTEQPDNQKNPSKKNNETTKAPSSTPRTKKQRSTKPSGGKAAAKANKEMDAADLLVAAMETTIKVAEKSALVGDLSVKDMGKQLKKIAGQLTPAKMQAWLENADNSKAMDAISNLQSAKKKLTALMEATSTWQNKAASADDLQAALLVLTAEGIRIADDVQLDVVRRRVVMAVEEPN